MSTLWTNEHDAVLALMLDLAAAARPVTLGHFRADPSMDCKPGADFDPVTEADTGAERALRAQLAEYRPSDAIVGEEYGTAPGTSGWTWYLDPIDGTRAYVAGLPSWTTLVGLADQSGMPVYGMIDCPALGETYLGWPGGAGVRMHGEWDKLSVSGCDDLRTARISTTDPFLFTPAEEGAWTHLRATARITRYGLDAYAYARLAGGTLELVAESSLKPWDAAALIPVVRGAGGLALDWRGRPATARGGQLVCACHDNVMEQALLALRRSAD